MKINRFFPTLIASDNNPDITSSFNPILRNIISRLDRTQELKYVTSYDYIELNEKILKYEIGVIPNRHLVSKPFKEYLKNFIEKIGFIIPPDIKYDFWTTKIQSLTPQPLSSHKNHLISGICYTRTKDPEGRFSPLVFKDPKTTRYEDRLTSTAKEDKSTSTIDNLETITFYPKVGDIFIWESWLEYQIQPSPYDEQLMVMFNLYK
tara:strand:+ start:1466 stop:2083 length:618 start_codon:yes stop_codon:yes gene_type:complete